MGNQRSCLHEHQGELTSLGSTLTTKGALLHYPWDIQRNEAIFLVLLREVNTSDDCVDNQLKECQILLKECQMLELLEMN
jgi:hypothetical protein